ncbi:MAG: AbrB/MazE/SpoVT family DNA-binding domain-containing protein [Methanosarcinales archaeon]
MKKYCGICDKETEYEEKIVNVLKGVIGIAEVCKECGEEWVSENELRRAYRELKERNLLTLKQKIKKLGDKLAIEIPKEIANAFNLEHGDTIELYRTKDEIRIKVSQ